jgi:hypothetical protein
VRRGAIYLLFVGLAVIAAVVLRGHFYYDDAYITFRMAANIAHGHGWTYNPGLSQDAATGALWTLLLAAMGSLGVGIVGVANVLSAIFLAGAAIVMFETFALMGARRAGIFVGIFIAGSEFLALNRGMELPLVIFLISATLYLTQRNAFLLAGVAAGLAVLGRGDAALFAGILGVSLAIGYGKEALRFAAGIASVLIPWAVYATVAIGHILPGTLTAKIDQGRSGYWSGSGTYNGLLQRLPFSEGGHFEIWFGLVGLLGIAGLIVLARRRELRPLWPLVAFGFAYVLAYGFVLRVPGYLWYYALPMFAGLVVAGVGLDVVVSAIERRRPIPGALVPTLLAVGVSAVSLAGAPAAVPRLAGYAAASRWLDLHAQPGASVAAAEIGVVGWDNPNRTVIDYLGLTSTTAADRLAHRDLLWWVSHETPDYWITLSHGDFAEDEQVLTASWFPKAFKVVWSDQWVTLYVRVGPIPSQR